MQVDEKALIAAFRVNHHPDAEPSSVELARLRIAITAYLAALGEQKPVAWRWKQKGRTDADAWNYSFGHPQLSSDLYVAELLYASPLPVRPITDEDVERAAKAIQATKINGQRVRFADAYAVMMARAALEAAGGRG